VKKLWKAAAAVGAAALAVPLLAISPASAAPTDYSWDGSAHIITGGGSDTTYKAMVGITTVYDGAPGCAVTTASGVDLGDCAAAIPTPGNPGDGVNLGNAERDTVAEANPTGSGAGISALANGTVYNGANNGHGNDRIAFARSSRAPKSTELNNGSNSVTGWGFAQDGVQITVFNQLGQYLNNPGSPIGGALTFNDLWAIYDCQVSNWNEIDGRTVGGHTLSDLNIAPGSALDGPIVPWGMNSASGTYGTFSTFVQNGASPTDSTFDPNAHHVTGGTSPTCVQSLNNNDGSHYPLENDIKGITGDYNATTGRGAPVADSSGTHNDVHNPKNWIWWDSYGEMSTFPYKSAQTVGGVAIQSYPGPINGVLPSTGNIGGNSYPMGRTLYHVTLKSQADCPHASVGDDTCAFGANPGPTVTGGVADLGVVGPTNRAVTADSDSTTAVLTSNPTGQFTANDVGKTVTGTCLLGAPTVTKIIGFTDTSHVTLNRNASSTTSSCSITVVDGPGAAVKEFTRFLCRQSALQHTVDPYFGTNDFTLITQAITGAGFTTVPSALRTTGSRCKVLSH
jgi:ABC-type phosphate transport system substrate-binding protein